MTASASASASAAAPPEPTDPPGGPPRAPGELTPRELLRWAWRQLTSMRTALVLLLLLALAAVPGSVVPQADVDALAVSRWREDHPRLAPVYDRLGLFSVYDSVWFSAVYLLLVVSLVGCIIPRCGHYWRSLRARPPRAPRHLTRLADHLVWTTAEPAAEVAGRAARVLRGRRFRVAAGPAGVPEEATVSAERGYLREAGNLLFHLAVLVVLAGFAVGALFGYRGGVIVLVGGGFSNNLTQYDDFAPGALFDPAAMEPFSFDLADFDLEWVEDGPSRGMARNFVTRLDYQEAPGSPTRSYDLRVNHPLRIGGTEIFLIGHGYAPVITVRDRAGEVAFRGPVVFLPQDQSFTSFGVVKVPAADPQIGLDGLFFPTYVNVGGDPMSVLGDARNPTLSMQAYAGDLGLDTGTPQSVYELRKDGLRLLERPDGSMFRVDLQVGQTARLPDGVGSVTFDGVQRWNKLQVSRTPATWVALAGVSLALLGLLGSLFVRPRRVWLRARPGPDGTVVELAGLDRSGGGDVRSELVEIRTRLGEEAP